MRRCLEREGWVTVRRLFARVVARLFLHLRRRRAGQVPHAVSGPCPFRGLRHLRLHHCRHLLADMVDEWLAASLHDC